MSSQTALAVEELQLSREGERGASMGKSTEVSESRARLRDTRRAEWFWVENALVDVFQPIIGPLGVSVYSALCREVRKEEVRVTLRELGEMAGVSKDTAARMIWKMCVLGMIGEKHGGKRNDTRYELFDLKDAAAHGLDALRQRLAQAEIERVGGTSAHTPKPVEPVPDDAGGLFDGATGSPAPELEVSPMTAGWDALPSMREPSSVTGPVEFVSVRDNNRPDTVSQPETSLSQAKPFLSQERVVLSQAEDMYLIKQREDIRQKTTTLNPSASGGTLEDLSDPPRQEPVSALLDRLATLKPRLGDIEDLRGQVQSGLHTAGFRVERGAPIPNRGDGQRGYIELLATRGTGSATERIAIEIDAMVPRERSLMKLRRCGAAWRVVFLRTARRTGTPPLGIDRMIALAWPDNGAAALADDAIKRVHAAGNRARVGLEPATMSEGPGLSPNAGTVRAVLGDVRRQIEGFGLEALAEWDKLFGGVGYEHHEVPEGASSGLLLVVSSPDPQATRAGMKIYGARVRREFARAFGVEARLQIGADMGCLGGNPARKFSREETYCD